MPDKRFYEEIPVRVVLICRLIPVMKGQIVQHGPFFSGVHAKKAPALIGPGTGVHVAGISDLFITQRRDGLSFNNACLIRDPGNTEV